MMLTDEKSLCKRNQENNSNQETKEIKESIELLIETEYIRSGNIN